jgi:hypothetical protein
VRAVSVGVIRKGIFVGKMLVEGFLGHTHLSRDVIHRDRTNSKPEKQAPCFLYDSFFGFHELLAPQNYGNYYW